MPSLYDSGKLVGTLARLRPVAQSCKASFPLSLRQFLDIPNCPFSRVNHLHLKILTTPDLAIDTMLNRMREIYRSAGIRVQVVSRENLSAATLGAAAFNNLNDLDVAQCKDSTSDEQNALFANQNSVPGGQRASEIVVYFVRSVTKTAGGSLNGCATFPAGQPGAAIAKIASRWTLAHEVGHVLGLQHISGEHTGCPETNPQCCSTPDFTRLMTGCSTSNIVGTPTVDSAEMNTMTSSSVTLSG
jgi:predicted Zn-dependent protease